MVKGIIYMYISPSGKPYIGQTTDEKKRRASWNSSSYDYAGDKINKARAKYGKDSFAYTVLHSGTYPSKKEAVKALDLLEIFYISLYDSVKNGYNCEGGGHACTGYTLSEEARRNIGIASHRRQQTPEGKAKMRAAKLGIVRTKGYRLADRYKAVVQLTLFGEYVREFPSMRDAEEYMFNRGSIPKNRSNIGAVCNGKRDSAMGYKWLFKEDYYEYFLHSNREDIPQRVQRVIDCIAKRNAPKEKKKYGRKTKPKKEGPRINRFAQKIGQYSLDLQLIKVWRSVNDIAKELGIWQSNISRAVNTFGVYKGFYWRRFNGEITIQPKPKKKIVRPKLYKKVVQKDLQGNVVNIFDSIGLACDYVGAKNRTVISRCLNGRGHTAYGFKWEFLKCS